MLGTILGPGDLFWGVFISMSYFINSFLIISDLVNFGTSCFSKNWAVLSKVTEFYVHSVAVFPYLFPFDVCEI